MSEPTPEENADAIDENADAIDENADAIDENADAIDENADAIEENAATNESQQAQLDDISSGVAVEDTSLPASNTPVGSERRIKLYAPNPESIITIGSKTGSSGEHGEDGINIGAADNLNITIGADTNIYSGMRYVNTGTTVTEVSGEDMAISSAANYRLRTEKGVEITAGGAGPALECFDVLSGNTDAVAAPEIDTASERSATETVSTVFGTVFKAYDFYCGVASFAKKPSEPKGAKAAGSTAGKWNAFQSKVNAARKVGEGLWTALGAAVPAVPEWVFGPSKSKVKIHGADGVSITSPWSVKAFANHSVSVGGAVKFGAKGGVSASLKSGGGATVFGVLGAKVESLAVAELKGKVAAVGGDFVELNGKKSAHVLGGKAVEVESDGDVSISGAESVFVASKLAM